MKPVKIICDKYLLCLGLLTVSLHVGTGVLMIILFALDIAKTETEIDKIGCIIFFATLVLGMLVAGVLAWPKWYCRIILTGEQITLKIPFHFPQVLNYHAYGYLYIATYRHIFKKQYYILLSQVPVSAYDLTHVNHIKSSEKTIKIRYTLENVRLLQQVLSSKQIRILARVTTLCPKTNGTRDASPFQNEKSDN